MAPSLSHHWLIIFILPDSSSSQLRITGSTPSRGWRILRLFFVGRAGQQTGSSVRTCLAVRLTRDQISITAAGY